MVQCVMFVIDTFFRRETLEKMLNEGTTIVMDRYAYSGVAYSAAKVRFIKTLLFVLNVLYVI